MAELWTHTEKDCGKDCGKSERSEDGALEDSPIWENDISRPGDHVDKVWRQDFTTFRQVKGKYVIIWYSFPTPTLLSLSWHFWRHWTKSQVLKSTRCLLNYTGFAVGIRWDLTYLAVRWTYYVPVPFHFLLRPMIRLNEGKHIELTKTSKTKPPPENWGGWPHRDYETKRNINCDRSSRKAIINMHIYIYTIRYNQKYTRLLKQCP